MRKIKVMRDGRPATAEELQCAVEGKPLPPSDCSASAPELSKPPLGCRPRWIAEEIRLIEVASAVSRYLDAGKPVPTEWVEEMIDHIGNMGRWSAWKHRAAMTPNDGTQRPGDAEATNATKATPPGSLK